MMTECFARVFYFSIAETNLYTHSFINVYKSTDTRFLPNCCGATELVIAQFFTLMAIVCVQVAIS
jgi:hypothetical protein